MSFLKTCRLGGRLYLGGIDADGPAPP